MPQIFSLYLTEVFYFYVLFFCSFKSRCYLKVQEIAIDLFDVLLQGKTNLLLNNNALRDISTMVLVPISLRLVHHSRPALFGGFIPDWPFLWSFLPGHSGGGGGGGWDLLPDWYIFWIFLPGLSRGHTRGGSLTYLTGSQREGWGGVGPLLTWVGWGSCLPTWVAEGLDACWVPYPSPALPPVLWTDRKKWKHLSFSVLKLYLKFVEFVKLFCCQYL